MKITGVRGKGRDEGGVGWGCHGGTHGLGVQGVGGFHGFGIEGVVERV